MDGQVEVLKRLKKEYGGFETALDYKTPLQLLVATILSAQCTDARVNIVTKSLFKRYKSAKDFANARQSALEKDVKSTGFYRNKAKNIRLACRMIVEDYDGKVPDSMAELVRLPGVARKTANIVLNHAFNKVEGIAVDTHAKRLSYRMGWTENTSPEKIEQDLMNSIPKRWWKHANSLLVMHGRQACNARKPKCSQCVVEDLCPKNGVERKG
ncbi:MAG TPA: endonuclease III [Candidatus Altiarchaeales archaeon]|nr:endonuclease III [Candidatus Altiarchaeales archaeon]